MVCSRSRVSLVTSCIIISIHVGCTSVVVAYLENTRPRPTQISQRLLQIRLQRLQTLLPLTSLLLLSLQILPQLLTFILGCVHLLIELIKNLLHLRLLMRVHNLALPPLLADAFTLILQRRLGGG